MAKDTQTPRFEMRLATDLAARVDAWRAKQPGIPSRAAAVRTLTEAALTILERDERTRLASKDAPPD